MKPKLIVTLALGLFVAASVVYIVVGQADKGTSKPTVRADGKGPKERLVVYYFHRTKRCPGCKNLEKLARETLNRSYAKELASGLVELRSLNLEDKANEAFVTKYEIYGSTLVLSVVVDGKEQSHKSLEKAFELKFAPGPFDAYLKGEIEALLAPLRAKAKS
jgi:hypothetical protein